MSGHTQTLKELALALLSADQSAQLGRIIHNGVIDFSEFIALDESLGWATMSNVTIDKHGNYDILDRDVFRPLQYCNSYFAIIGKDGEMEWFTRSIVHMSSLHVESLVSRISLSHRLPLGRAIRERIFKQQVDSATWDMLERFRHVFNAAKHDMDHPKDTHLFSLEDAVQSYFVCRAFGNRLRHLAKLNTDFAE